MKKLILLMLLSSPAWGADCISPSKTYSGAALTSVLVCLQNEMKTVLNAAADKGVSVYEDKEISVYSSEATQQEASVNIKLVLKNKTKAPMIVELRESLVMASDKNGNSCADFRVSPDSLFGTTVQAGSEQIFLLSERCATAVSDYSTYREFRNLIYGDISLTIQLGTKSKKNKEYVGKVITLNNLTLPETVRVPF